MAQLNPNILLNDIHVTYDITPQTGCRQPVSDRQNWREDGTGRLVPPGTG